MPTKTKMPRARIELYKVKKGGWKFEAFGGNRKVVGRSEEPIKQRAYQAKRARAQFPGLPVYVREADGSFWLYE